MSVTTLTTEGSEGSGYALPTITFQDTDGNDVTPTAITWTLSDDYGNIINDRDAEAITPDASVHIALVAADTTAVGQDEKDSDYFYRRVLIAFIYNTTIGGTAYNNYPGKIEYRIKIQNFKNV